MKFQALSLWSGNYKLDIAFMATGNCKPLLNTKNCTDNMLKKTTSLDYNISKFTLRMNIKYLYYSKCD